MYLIDECGNRFQRLSPFIFRVQSRLQVHREQRLMRTPNESNEQQVT